MAIRDMFKISRKTFLNPTGWIDYDNLKFRTQTMWDVLKGLFTIETADRVETFEQSMQRQGLSEAAVEQLKKTYQLYTVIFFICGLLLFFYSFYLLFGPHTLAGFLIGVAGSGVFFSQAFRFDFWVMQMTQRKLGMTFDDWKSRILGDKRTSS